LFSPLPPRKMEPSAGQWHSGAAQGQGGARLPEFWTAQCLNDFRPRGQSEHSAVLETLCSRVAFLENKMQSVSEERKTHSMLGRPLRAPALDESPDSVFEQLRSQRECLDALVARSSDSGARTAILEKASKQLAVEHESFARAVSQDLHNLRESLQALVSERVGAVAADAAALEGRTKAVEERVQGYASRVDGLWAASSDEAAKHRALEQRVGSLQAMSSHLDGLCSQEAARRHALEERVAQVTSSRDSFAEAVSRDLGGLRAFLQRGVDDNREWVAKQLEEMLQLMSRSLDVRLGGHYLGHGSSESIGYALQPDIATRAGELSSTIAERIQWQGDGSRAHAIALKSELAGQIDAMSQEVHRLRADIGGGSKYMATKQPERLAGSPGRPRGGDEGGIRGRGGGTPPRYGSPPASCGAPASEPLTTWRVPRPPDEPRKERGMGPAGSGLRAARCRDAYSPPPPLINDPGLPQWRS